MNIVILIDLIRRRRYDLARHLIYTKGYPLDLRDNRGNTALSWASKCNLPNMVRILCMNGALIDNRDDTTFNDTPISWAVYNGNIECACILLQYGADINQQTQLRGNSLLTWAYKQRRLNIFEMLLYQGINSSLRMHNYQTVYHICELAEYSMALQHHKNRIRRVIREIFNDLGRDYEYYLPETVLGFY